MFNLIDCLIYFRWIIISGLFYYTIATVYYFVQLKEYRLTNKIVPHGEKSKLLFFLYIFPVLSFFSFMWILSALGDTLFLSSFQDFLANIPSYLFLITLYFLL